MVDQAKRNMFVMLAVLAFWNIGLTYQVVVTSIAARKAQEQADYALRAALIAHGARP